MDPLHICLLNDSFPPMLDGVANVMKNYADIITRRYGTATVVTPAYPNVNDDYPYEVVRYASVDTTKLVGYRTGYPFDAKVLERLSGVQMDLMHVHCPFISAQLCRVIRETRDVPVVFTYHTKFDIDVRKAVRMKLIQDAALKIIVDNIAACDDVWVVSEGAGKNRRSIGYQGNYLVMPNGVDMPKGRADAAAVDAVRKAYGIDPDVTVYLFVGRMMWYKGLRIILDALRMLKNAGKRFSALFVGDGLDRKEIEAYMQSLSLQNECKFLGAIHERETLRAIYAACDLFLFPSTFDTNGIVVREAAANGLASVLIADSCAAEGVAHGRNGLLIEETPEAMANLLYHVNDRRAALRTLGDAAMEELYFSWDDSVKNAVERYRLILSDRERFRKPRQLTGSDDFFQTVSQWFGVHTQLASMQNRVQTFAETRLRPLLTPPESGRKKGPKQN